MKTETIRRGRATEFVFAFHTEAIEIRHDVQGASAHKHPDTTILIDIQMVREIFNANKKARMTLRSDGTCVFVVPDYYGWTRYEIR